MKNVIITGKRKASICRLYITEDGKYLVNKKDISQYFASSETLRKIILDVAQLSKIENTGFKCNVHGGGLSGQADAIKYAFAKAILQRYYKTMNTEDAAAEKKVFRARNYVTIDTRKKEPKKPGFFRSSRARKQRSAR